MLVEIVRQAKQQARSLGVCRSQKGLEYSKHQVSYGAVFAQTREDRRFHSRFGRSLSTLAVKYSLGAGNVRLKI
jgi:hypothetical protein